MANNEIVVQQINSSNLQIEKLPDGSTAVFDTATQSIHSLDPLAAAAFIACRDRKTLPQLTDAMSKTLGTPITDVVTLNAISELERAGLVACSNFAPSATEIASRRSLLRAAGTAMPVVLSLTSMEQSAFAQRAGSGILATTTTTTAAPTTTTTTTAAPATTTTTTTTTTTPAPVALIASVIPAFIGECNLTQNAVIIGQNTHFSSASVVTLGASNLTVSGVTATSPTSISLTIKSTPGNRGPVNVTVVTGSETTFGFGAYAIGGCN